MVIPFITLLLLIAIAPLFFQHFWEHNYHRVAIFLGLITTGYYMIVLKDFVSLRHTLVEYLSFIALLGSLFVASGGILIKVDKKATPLFNTLFLLVGAVISNVIGTTGASMLLIRPFMRMNKGRIKPYHIIFFIFVVSNAGGALTPIGDPPLFLGFLKGIPFFWVIEHVWFIWLLTLGMILAVFFFLDSANKAGKESENEYSGKFYFKGLKNLAYLGIIIISVFLDPAVISWIPSLDPLPIGVREIIMFSVIFISYKTADKEALKANEFDFAPIKEVAYLFVGIFFTMIPALRLIADMAKENSDVFTGSLFYWATGSLSSFLDNAPTYLNFLSAAMGKFGHDINGGTDATHAFLQNADAVHYLVAISVSSVFFGAMTYIGNGPNFMVKSISERAGVRVPTFIEYMFKYSLPILLPIYGIIWFFFFRG
ncbi:MAG: sodium:proton antiporter [Ignavibacteriaceae bacterium]|nr:sodium:proton antiporter [Ignavibacteriaceae bacterium]